MEHFRIGAIEVGRELREARLRLGLSIDAIASVLRIRATYLEMLESGSCSELPASVYRLGYARIYAMKLGLDPAAVAARLEAAAAAAPRLVERFEASPPRRANRKAPTALAAMVSLTLLYLFSTQYESGQIGAAEVADVPARLVAIVDASATQHAAPAPSVPEVRAAHPPLEDPRAQLRPEQQPVPRVAAVVDPILAVRVALQAAPGSGDGVWVRVRVAQSRELVMARVLRPGEIWKVPPRDNLVLDVGKAHELRVLVDGALVPAQEGFRGVRRGVAVMDLLPENLRHTSTEPRTMTRPTALANR